MQKALNILFTTAIAVLLGTACTTIKTESIDPNDMSYLYNPLRNRLHPRYRVYHDNDQLSTLSIKFYSSELYFSEANPEGVPIASMNVFYRLFNLSQGRVAVDTSFVKIPVRQQKGKREYIYSFPLDAPTGYRYEIELLIKDAIRNTSIQAHIPFDKSTLDNRHSYKVRGHFNGYEIFTPVLRESDYINLLVRDKQTDTLYLKYFRPYDRVPDPPSMLVPEREISYEPVNVIPIAYSDTLPLMFPRRGVFHLSDDSLSLKGYTIFNFGKTYPGMNEAATMIPPLIYLAGEDRINEMLSASNKKIALDNFWLELTDNVERSRELVRIYYNRVLYANHFFSSYKEGWRTDRGMIFIIYGPPDKLYKTPEGEKWGYLKPEVRKGWGIRYRVSEEYLYFTFAQRENPFTYNDYTLVRSESLTTYWDQAIRSWLSGIVFRLDNPTDL